MQIFDGNLPSTARRVTPMSERAYRDPIVLVGERALYGNARRAASIVLALATLLAAAVTGSTGTQRLCAPHEDTLICRLLRLGPTWEGLHVPSDVEGYLCGSPLPWLIAMVAAAAAFGLVERTSLMLDAATRELVVRRTSLLRSPRIERIALDAIREVQVRVELGFASACVVDHELRAHVLTPWRAGRARADRLVRAIESARAGELEAPSSPPRRPRAWRWAGALMRTAALLSVLVGVGLGVGWAYQLARRVAAALTAPIRSLRRDIVRGDDGRIRLFSGGHWVASDQPTWDAFLLDRRAALHEGGPFPTSPLWELARAPSGEVSVAISTTGCEGFRWSRVHLTWSSDGTALERDGGALPIEPSVARRFLLSLADAAERPDEARADCEGHLTSMVAWDGGGSAGEASFRGSVCGSDRDNAHRIRALFDELPRQETPDWYRTRLKPYDRVDAATGIRETALIPPHGEPPTRIHLYARTPTGWRPTAHVALPLPTHATFGRAVAVSGPTLVVGDMDSIALDGDTMVASDTSADDDAGAVFALRRHGESWLLEATLHGSSPLRRDIRYGRAVSVSGDTIAVAAGEMVDVYVRARGAWSLQQHVRLHGVPGWDADAVSLRGDRLLVGSGFAFVERTTTGPSSARSTRANRSRTSGRGTTSRSRATTR